MPEIEDRGEEQSALEKWFDKNKEKFKLAPVYLILFLFFIALPLGEGQITYLDLLIVLGYFAGTIGAIILFFYVFKHYLEPTLIKALRIKHKGQLLVIYFVLFTVSYVVLVCWKVLTSNTYYIDWIFYAIFYVYTAYLFYKEREKEVKGKSNRE